MKKEIDYEALQTRLEQSLVIAKKLGLRIVSCGGYAMDYSMDRLPSYPVGLFGALSIVEGPGARGKLGLTYLETAAIEDGFNSIRDYSMPSRIMKKNKRKKTESYLRLEQLGKDLAKKFIIQFTRTARPKTKKKSMSSSYSQFIDRAPSSSSSRIRNVISQALLQEQPVDGGVAGTISLAPPVRPSWADAIDGASTWSGGTMEAAPEESLSPSMEIADTSMSPDGRLTMRATIQMPQPLTFVEASFNPGNISFDFQDEPEGEMEEEMHEEAD